MFSYRERVISAVDSLALGSIGWYRKYALASSQNVLDAAPRGKIKTIALDATSQSSAVWQFSTVATQALVNGLSGRKFAIITVSGEKYLAFASGLSDSGGNLSSLKGRLASGDPHGDGKPDCFVSALIDV